ncbi:MAG TPA: GMC family oxidoreductase [Alphaproteobacteria bacterium]|nr:GMC family oxidoreductase [Alphaproteobacteria bacterium]
MGITQNIDALDGADPFDICIIGSGFAGTTLGVSLVADGVRTLLLESGGSLARWLLDERVKGLAAYEVSRETNYPTKRTKARALGGNSNFWTGRCERFHPSDFVTHAYTPENNPWPISYADIEPYYESAEKLLRVRGNALSQYAPPRRGGFPVPSRSHISPLQARLAKVGVRVDESPTATPQKALRFFRVQNELLPRFLASPYATLVSGATATRLHAGGDGRIMGVEVRTLDGTRKVARARAYVIACGGLETPRLLLLSRSEGFASGIGNAHDRVGRGFNEHPGVNFYAKLRRSRDTITPRHRIGRSHQFYDQFRREGLGSVLPVFIQSWVFPNHLIYPRFSDLPGYVSALLGRAIQPTLYIGATIEMLPRDDNRVTLSKHAKDRFGNPLAHLSLSLSEEDRGTLERARDLIRKIYDSLGAAHIQEAELTWSRHHIGACRMGEDPTTSVCDPHLRVHACPNLYLCGSETFVTGGAIPPALTITALALRLSEHLKRRLQEAGDSTPNDSRRPHPKV